MDREQVMLQRDRAYIRLVEEKVRWLDNCEGCEELDRRAIMLAEFHAACCRQLESIEAPALDEGERGELLSIMDELDSVDGSTPDDDILVARLIEDLRVIAARGGDA